MTKKIPTVTVALSALNEEYGIKKFLESVLKQKEDGFILERILIISDGSTDRTVDVAKSFKSRKIIVKAYKTRKGKSFRLNEIYKSLRSDILIQSDADVSMSNPLVFRELIIPFIKNEKVAMVGGHGKPVLGDTFTERAVMASFEAYEKMRKYNDALTVTGQLLAYRKEFAKKITIPETMIGNDIYTYFLCLTMGYKYEYAENAISYFRVPKTLKDQIKQNTRYSAVPTRMTKYFSKELVDREDYIPASIYYSNLAMEFIKHPILSGYIMLVNSYCRIKAKFTESKLTGKWDMVNSTKKFNN